ncbi:hypothetical protein [Polyangium jinanense]|uniref:Uncharacterized protein n=1 Tax=Polyangium jinanense TaxID=2829994 RepID=A0A9X3XDG3_9BACT|nr:hypothetical protein [Polyangium jinanense]MDC3962516.1 hypothetical protein [Polyangium jinanense]MDC3986066.1 hypothetical protein [Polyangium jinanense]
MKEAIENAPRQYNFGAAQQHCILLGIEPPLRFSCLIPRYESRRERVRGDMAQWKDRQRADAMHELRDRATRIWSKLRWQAPHDGFRVVERELVDRHVPDHGIDIPAEPVAVAFRGPPSFDPVGMKIRQLAARPPLADLRDRRRQVFLHHLPRRDHVNGLAHLVQCLAVTHCGALDDVWRNVVPTALAKLRGQLRQNRSASEGTCLILAGFEHEALPLLRSDREPREPLAAPLVHIPRCYPGHDEPPALAARPA